MFFRPLYTMAVRSLTYFKNSFALRHRQGECGWTGGHMYICTYNSVVYHQKIKISFLKLRLESDLSHRKSNFRFIWWFRVVSDLSPTLGKIGHQWFFFLNGTPDGKTNGLGFAISGPIIHTNCSGEKIRKKFF